MAARAPDFTWECRRASGAAPPPYGGECVITRSEKRWKWRQKPVCLPLRASPSNTYEDDANDPPGGASNSRQAARMLRHTNGPRYLLAFSLETSSAYFSGEVSANAASRVEGESSYGTGSANWLTVRSHALPSIRL